MLRDPGDTLAGFQVRTLQSLSASLEKHGVQFPTEAVQRVGGGQLASLQVLQTLRDMSEARGQAGVLSHKELRETTAAQPI